MEVFLVRLGKVSRRAVSGLRFELFWGASRKRENLN